MMPSLKQKLLALLENAARVAVVGIGSELRGDDAAGLLALEHLRKRLKIVSPAKQQRRKKPVVKLFNGGTAPENMTGEIRRFQPGHLVMIDAVELGRRPGTIELIDIKKAENISFLTHKLPVKLMLDYLAGEMTFTTVFIGIQPKSLDFGAPVSKEVSHAVRVLADWLNASAPGLLYSSDDKRKTNSRQPRQSPAQRAK